MATLLPITRLLGLDPGRDQLDMVASEMIRHGWTAAEVAFARDVVPRSARLIKEAAYHRASIFAVMTLARERIEIRRGRLFTAREYLDLTSRGTTPTRAKALKENFVPVKDEETGVTSFFLENAAPFIDPE